MLTFLLFLHYIKDVSKKSKHDRKNRCLQTLDEQIGDGNSDIIELDVNLHCRDLTVRELEFSMVSSLQDLTLNPFTIQKCLKADDY